MQLVYSLLTTGPGICTRYVNFTSAIYQLQKSLEPDIAQFLALNSFDSKSNWPKNSLAHEQLQAFMYLRWIGRPSIVPSGALTAVVLQCKQMLRVAVFLPDNYTIAVYIQLVEEVLLLSLVLRPLSCLTVLQVTGSWARAWERG